MPKKKPARNAFYCFLQDYKEEHRQKGFNLSYDQAADYAGPIWRDMLPPARAKYEEQATKAMQLNRVPNMKFSSEEVSTGESEREEAEKRLVEKTEIKEICNIVMIAALNNAVQKKNFFLMDLNSFCKVNGRYIVGEITLLQFNLIEGICNDYHEVIVPDCVPVGYASDAKAACDELGLKYPYGDKPASNYSQTLFFINHFLREQSPDAKAVPPPIFTIPEKIEAVKDFIFQLCNKAREDETLFRVYKIDRLFYEVINAIKAHKSEGFPKESLALRQLKKDTFKYNRGLACEHHEAGDRDFECSMSRVKRWAYTILDHCCPVANIEMIPGQHIPSDYNMDIINKYRSEAVERINNTVAAVRLMDISYGANSTGQMSTAFNPSWDTVVDSTKPAFGNPSIQIRRPLFDYSQTIRQYTADAGESRGQSAHK